MFVERHANVTVVPSDHTMLSSLPVDVQRLISASLSEGTKRGYQQDIAHFEAWGGSIPASAETIAAYSADSPRGGSTGLSSETSPWLAKEKSVEKLSCTSA